ncbi:MAG: gamma-glutamylcyclotransferase family protein [Deltaproteobacteria bacterium]
MTSVFVYGRLTTDGFYHQHYLQGQTLLGTGSIDDYRSYIIGGLQGIVPRDGFVVKGELYEVDEKALGKLDHLHNIGTVFNRSIVDIKLDNGEILPAEVYILIGNVA